MGDLLLQLGGAAQPLAAGTVLMVPTAVAMFGMSTLSTDTGSLPMPAIAEKIVGVAHGTFISGMGLACLVAAGVAVVAVFVALLTKRGANAEAGAGAAHI